MTEDEKSIFKMKLLSDYSDIRLVVCKLTSDVEDAARNMQEVGRDLERNGARSGPIKGILPAESINQKLEELRQALVERERIAAKMEDAGLREHIRHSRPDWLGYDVTVGP